MLEIDMKDATGKITTIIIALVVIKTMDFSNPGILDYAIILLTLVWLVLKLINWKRRRS